MNRSLLGLIQVMLERPQLSLEGCEPVVTGDCDSTEAGALFGAY